MFSSRCVVRADSIGAAAATAALLLIAPARVRGTSDPTQLDWIPLDLAGSSTPPLGTARIQRDQAGSGRIWADSIGAAAATAALLLRAPTCGRDVGSDPT